jgi:hypothetical protein
MRFFVLFVFIFIISCNNADKKPTENKIASKHSAAFNRSFDSLMTAYYNLTEAFVNWDSVAIINSSTQLDNRIKHTPLDELGKDEALLSKANLALFNMQDAVLDIVGKNDITTKRHSLNTVSENLFGLLSIVQYDENKVYLQECTMPFNDTGRGVWLSKTDDIRNPYLGMHHPTYGKGMLVCGNNKSTIDFQNK